MSWVGHVAPRKPLVAAAASQHRTMTAAALLRPDARRHLVLTSLHADTGSVALALTDLARRGIWVQPWVGHRVDVSCYGPDQPVLYVVAAEDAPPPSWGVLEDWLRLPSDHDEVHQRADRLIERAERRRSSGVHLDDDDLLHAGDRRTPLSPLEAQLLRLLLDQPGRVVSRDSARRVLWGDEVPVDPRALDNRVKTLRARLRGLPLWIYTVRGRGFMLEHATRRAGCDPDARPQV